MSIKTRTCLPIRWMAKSRFPDDYPANYRRPGWCRPCSPAWKRQSTRSSDLRAMLRTKLRSPVSFVRNTAELALRNRQIDPASRRAFEQIVAECGKTSRLLKDMLTLAWADAGNARLAFEPVDQVEVVKTVCQKARSLEEEHWHTLVECFDAGGSATVWGDYSSLQRVPVDTSGECREVYLRREPPRSRRQRLGETQS